MKNLYNIYESLLGSEEEITSSIEPTVYFDQFVDWVMEYSHARNKLAAERHCVPAKDRMDVGSTVYLNIAKDTPLPPVKLGIVECIDIHGDNEIWNHPKYLPTKIGELDLINGNINGQKLNVEHLTIRECGIKNCEFIFPASLPGLRKNVSFINWVDFDVKTWDDIKTCKFTSEGCILGLNICHTDLAEAVVNKLKKDWAIYRKSHPDIMNKESVSRNREINECLVKSINDMIPLDEFHKQNPKVRAIYFKMRNQPNNMSIHALKPGDVMILWERMENGIPQWKVSQRAIKV